MSSVGAPRELPSDPWHRQPVLGAHRPPLARRGYGLRRRRDYPRGRLRTSDCRRHRGRQGHHGHARPHRRSRASDGGRVHAGPGRHRLAVQLRARRHDHRSLSRRAAPPGPAVRAADARAGDVHRDRGSPNHRPAAPARHARGSGHPAARAGPGGAAFRHRRRPGRPQREVHFLRLVHGRAGRSRAVRGLGASTRHDGKDRTSWATSAVGQSRCRIPKSSRRFARAAVTPKSAAP
jgi:hypothetical protein